MLSADQIVRRKGKRVEPEPCRSCGGAMTAYESRVKGYHKWCEPGVA